MRLIYMYDIKTSSIVELHDVTSEDEDRSEWLKLEMLIRCQYPCEVVDTADGDVALQAQFLHREIVRQRSANQCELAPQQTVGHSATRNKQQNCASEIDGAGSSHPEIVPLERYVGKP